MENGEVKAFAVLNEMEGAMQSDRFGWIKQDWKLVSASSEADNHQAALAFDEQPYSYWLSKPGKNQSIVTTWELHENSRDLLTHRKQLMQKA